MLTLLHADLRFVGRSNILSLYRSKGITNAQKLTCNIKIYKISWDWIPTKSKAQNGHLINGKDYILPTAQMKGASLYMESLHQSLQYRMPNGIRGNPQEHLKALLNQKAKIVHIVSGLNRRRKNEDHTPQP